MNETTLHAPAGAATPQQRLIKAGRIAWPLLALVCALLPLALPEYAIRAVALPTLIYGLSALGLTIVTGCAGQISMGQAAFMAIGAFISAISYGRYGLPVPVALLLAGLSGAAVALIVGLPSRRIRALYLMVSTLAAQVLVIWLIQRVPWFGAGSHGVVTVPPVVVAGIAITGTNARYLAALAVVVPMAVLGYRLIVGRFGRAWAAIREREVAAAVLGVPVARFKLYAFAISGFYAGVAGALAVFTWTGSALVEEYPLDLSIRLLGMIIIGGLGTVAGAFLGAAFVVQLPVALSVGLHAAAGVFSQGTVNTATLSNVEHVVFGVLILAFLIAEPRGLAALATRIATRLAARGATHPKTGDNT